MFSASDLCMVKRREILPMLLVITVRVVIEVLPCSFLASISNW